MYVCLFPMALKITQGACTGWYAQRIYMYLPVTSTRVDITLRFDVKGSPNIVNMQGIPCHLLWTSIFHHACERRCQRILGCCLSTYMYPILTTPLTRATANLSSLSLLSCVLCSSHWLVLAFHILQ